MKGNNLCHKNPKAMGEKTAIFPESHFSATKPRFWSPPYKSRPWILPQLSTFPSIDQKIWSKTHYKINIAIDWSWNPIWNSLHHQHSHRLIMIFFWRIMIRNQTKILVSIRQIPCSWILQQLPTFTPSIDHEIRHYSYQHFHQSIKKSDLELITGST